VVAMGFPAQGYESFYRNNIKDVLRFFQNEHQNKVKVYNMCIEQAHIYPKNKFSNENTNDIKVALFPFADHSSCPVKLILEFCVDLCNYLLQSKNSLAAIHCKAGKGRTGVMICSYLIFSGICKNSLEAFTEYAERRSFIRHGVTIPSQKRYVHHFETFLQCNFTFPYYQLLPKISTKYISNSRNLLINVFKDKSYYDYINHFKLKKIKIGPFKDKQSLTLKIENFKKQEKFNSGNRLENINFKYVMREELDPKSGKNVFFCIFQFNDNFIIDSDVNVSITGKKFKLNAWLNLFFISLEYFIFLMNDIVVNRDSNLLLPSPRAKNTAKNIFSVDKSPIKKMNTSYELGDLAVKKGKSEEDLNISIITSNIGILKTTNEKIKSKLNILNIKVMMPTIFGKMT
jgi:protein-tyrosine phosphatase